MTSGFPRRRDGVFFRQSPIQAWQTSRIAPRVKPQGIALPGGRRALEPLAGHRRLAPGALRAPSAERRSTRPATERLRRSSRRAKARTSSPTTPARADLGRHPLRAAAKPFETSFDSSPRENSAPLPRQHRARLPGWSPAAASPTPASGVIFVTLEDETGSINVVVWNRLVERQRSELLGARLLGVQGVIRARRRGRAFWSHGACSITVRLLGPLAAASRDSIEMLVSTPNDGDPRRHPWPDR